MTRAEIESWMDSRNINEDEEILINIEGAEDKVPIENLTIDEFGRPNIYIDFQYIKNIGFAPCGVIYELKEVLQDLLYEIENKLE